MDFNDHSKLNGTHAFLAASKFSWLNKDSDELIFSYIRQYAAPIGTALHDIARKHIKRRIKVNKFSKNEIVLQLVEDYGIPLFVIDRLQQFQEMYDNFATYVNDAVQFRMVPQVVLYFSENCYNTTDAITPYETIVNKRQLRIHDLKTGNTPAHIEQLQIYASTFCLEYRMKPKDLDIQLRIYQNNEIVCFEPDPTQIESIMKQTIQFDKLIRKVNEEG